MTVIIKVPAGLSVADLEWWYIRVAKLLVQFVVEDPIVCDGCGAEFKSTLDKDDDPVPLNDEAEEEGWTVEGDTRCPNCKYFHSDDSEDVFDLDCQRDCQRDEMALSGR